MITDLVTLNLDTVLVWPLELPCWQKPVPSLVFVLLDAENIIIPRSHITFLPALHLLWKNFTVQMHFMTRKATADSIDMALIYGIGDVRGLSASHLQSLNSDIELLKKINALDALVLLLACTDWFCISLVFL